MQFLAHSDLDAGVEEHWSVLELGWRFWSAIALLSGFAVDTLFLSWGPLGYTKKRGFLFIPRLFGDQELQIKLL